MESDRTAVFIVEAGVRGLVDYSKARLDDPAWWRKLRAVFMTMAREKNREVHKTNYDLQLALLANANLTEESFGKTQESARELRDDITGTYRPWLGQALKDRQKEQFKGYRQQYIDSFGVDPMDPGFKDWEAKEIAKLTETVPTEEELDEQKINERLKERDAKRRQGR